MSHLPNFSETKTTEAAVLLLKMAGGRMKYIRLLKLLYLSDRKAFTELGRSITNDHYCSMKYGQVSSNAYDLVKGTAKQTENVWSRFISLPINKHYISLTKNPSKINALSESEIDIICSVAMEQIDTDDFDLADITKGPEYVNVSDNRKAIHTPVERILDALDYTTSQIEIIKESLAEEAEIRTFFGG